MLPHVASPHCPCQINVLFSIQKEQNTTGMLVRFQGGGGLTKELLSAANADVAGVTQLE